MFCDEIVEEIRKKRQEHATKFNYDLNKIAADLNAKQSMHKRKVVSFQPKPPRIETIAMNIRANNANSADAKNRIAD